MLTKPDRAKASSVSRLTGTAEWKAVMDLLEQERHALQDALVRATNLQEIHRYQGAVLLLEDILKLETVCTQASKS